MDSGSFMERVYEGLLDEAMFRSFKSCDASERVDALFSEFEKILKEYPSDFLEREGRIPDDMLGRMGKLGLFGISIPREYGGLGFTLQEYLKIVEKMAGLDLAVALAAIAHLSIGVRGITAFGTEAQKRKYLPPAAAGDMIFSYALTEPKIGSDARNITTFAVLSEDGSHYILNGQKTFITNANYAGGLTVFAQMDPERPGFLGAFIVETRWDGVKVGKDMPKMGLKASSTASISLHDVRVPVENLIGSPGDGFKIAMTILNYGRLGLSAGSMGLMNRSIEDMVRRAHSRTQFGVPIEEFPLVQEKIVRARVYSFVSSAMVAFTSWLMESDPSGNFPIETSHCKLFCTTQGWNILYDALQVAGGSGYLSTQPYEKRMRDFRVATIFEGTTEIHSIYPSQYMFRRFNKEIRAADGGRTARLKYYWKKFFKGADWSTSAEDGVIREALRFAGSTAAAMRRMLVLGMLLYGNKVSERQFLLRRITVLSLYVYAVLAAIAAITADRARGCSNPEDLRLLAYFVAEAAEAKKQSTRILPSKKEKLGRIIFEDIRAKLTPRSPAPGPG